MKEFVYTVEQKDYAALKKIVEGDSLEGVSFARAGYTLRDSKGVGLKGGKYVLYFKTDEETGGKLLEKLKEIASLAEAEGGERETILKAINEQDDAAASGFGSIFG
ncbi:MAG: hypothetical protein V1834_02620 [Candidatus Micrarchaeota archaeon]